MILKKVWFSDLKIPKIYGPVCREEYAQEESSKRSELENMENQKII